MTIRTKAFPKSALAARLKPGLIQIEQFREAVVNLDQDEFQRFLRLYVEEGIPAAFYDAPIVWECVRDSLSARLGVFVKEITIVGSGKIGFSPTPKQFGKPFSADSDLDFSLIDGDLFEGVMRDARKFSSMVISGALRSKSQGVQAIWIENAKILGQNINSGFVDSKLVQSDHENFPVCAKINNEASILYDRLRLTGYPVKSISFRIYQDWGAFSERTRVNYMQIKKKMMAS